MQMHVQQEPNAVIGFVAVFEFVWHTCMLQWLWLMALYRSLPRLHSLKLPLQLLHCGVARGRWRPPKGRRQQRQLQEQMQMVQQGGKHPLKHVATPSTQTSWTLDVPSGS